MPKQYEAWMADDPMVGSDSNPGTQQLPWLTLQYSIDTLVAQRIAPDDTFVLHVLAYQVNDPAELTGPLYNNLTITGVQFRSEFAALLRAPAPARQQKGPCQTDDSGRGH